MEALPGDWGAMISNGAVEYTSRRPNDSEGPRKRHLAVMITVLVYGEIVLEAFNQ